MPHCTALRTTSFSDCSQCRTPRCGWSLVLGDLSTSRRSCARCTGYPSVSESRSSWQRLSTSAWTPRSRRTWLTSVDRLATVALEWDQQRPGYRHLPCWRQRTGPSLTLFTGHYLQWRMPPFMHQCWGLPHRLAQCTRPQGWGKLVNAALLWLINEAYVNVCCTTLLSSELVGPACVQARSSNLRGRACRPSGKGSGEEGILSGIVPVYLYCPAFSVSVSLGV